MDESPAAPHARKGLIHMRSGSNWWFLRGRLDGVTTRMTATGQLVSEVRLALPLGREREMSVMLSPLTTWNARFAKALAGLPTGTLLQITGHLSTRRWRAPGGGERVATEVVIDMVAPDIGLWLRAD
jgi:single-stranded DNA-binding protein